MGSTGVSGPTAVTGASESRFVASWRNVSGCYNGPIFENPAAAVLSFAAGAPPDRAAFALGFPIQSPPGSYSRSGANPASLGGNSVAVWHAVTVPEVSPPFTEVPFVAATWTGASGFVSPFSLSTRERTVIGRPAAAAGTASVLVVWAEGEDPAGSEATRIRSLRFTRADGRLDPDGGVVLAVAPSRIRSEPAVAFDGNAWVVVWVEARETAYDLRAVTVASDGTVRDAIPRLIAADVTPVDPAVASLGDGRIVVVYGRSEGDATAVRARMVSTI